MYWPDETYDDMPEPGRNKKRQFTKVKVASTRLNVGLGTFVFVTILVSIFAVIGFVFVAVIPSAVPSKKVSCTSVSLPAPAATDAHAQGAASENQDEARQARYHLRSLTEDMKAAAVDAAAAKLQNVSAKNTLQTLAEERKEELAAMMAEDPKAAREFILPDDERQALATVTSNCVEQETVIEATFGRVFVDDPRGQYHRHEYILRTEGRQDQQLFAPMDEVAHVESGSTVEARVYVLDQQALLAPPPPGSDDPGSSLAVVAPPELAAPVGGTKVLVLMADYSNTNVRTPDLTFMQNAVASLDQYYRENSYNEMSWIGNVHDWVEMPTARGTTCNVPADTQTAINLVDADIDFSQYNFERIVLLAPFAQFTGTNPSCHWGGIAFTFEQRFTTNEGPIEAKLVGIKVPTSPPETAITANDFQYVFRHELGHTIGNAHAAWYNCPAGESFYGSGTCFDSGPNVYRLEYDDPYDPMGGWYNPTQSAYAYGHFNAVHKEVSGWLEPSNIATVQNGDPTQTFTIEPIERPGPDLKVVKIQRNANQYTTIEYRQPNFADGSPTTDAAFQTDFPNVFNGALIHITDYSRSYLLDATPNATNSSATPTLGVGQSLTDPQTGSVIRVLSRTASALTVEVSTPNIDFWPPPGPAYINDGTGADEDTSPSTSSLSANWASIIDIGSGLREFKYEIFSSSGTSVKLGSVGTNTNTTVTGLSLTPGETYHFAVWAVDNFGSEGSPAITDGITITSGSPPSPNPTVYPTGALPAPPEIVQDGLDFYSELDATASSDILYANWPDVEDQSTFQKFQYAIGTTAGDTDVVSWTDAGSQLQISRHGLSLTAGSTYYVSVRVINRNNVAGPSVSSDGITVDRTPPPAPSFVFDGLGNDEDVTVNRLTLRANWASVTDPSGVEYQYSLGTTPEGMEFQSFVNRGNNTFLSRSGLILEEDQTYYVSVRAVDAAGNIGPPTSSDGVLIDSSRDTTPPTVSITNPSNGATVRSTVVVAVNASDDYGLDVVEIRIDGSLYSEDRSSPYEYTWYVGGYPNGSSHTVTATAKDVAGHSTASAPVTVTVDSSSDPNPPFVAITSPANNSTVVGSIQVRASTVDDREVLGVQFMIDGSPLQAEDTTQPYLITWDSTTAADGPHIMTAVARDSTNTATSAGVNVTVANVVDTAPPAVSISAPENGSTVSGSVTIQAAATDNIRVEGVTFKVDGTDISAEDTTAPYSVVWNTKTVLNGGYSITAVARDSQSSNTSVPVTVNVDNDRIPPSVILSTPPKNAYLRGIVLLSASADDNVGVKHVQFTLNGAALGPADDSPPFAYTWNTANTPSGGHVLNATATDTSNNTDIATEVPVTVDNGAPTVALVAPIAGSTVGGITLLTATATDTFSIVGVQFKLNGSNLGTEDLNAPYGISWDTRALPNGSYMLEAVARDRAGNTGTTDPMRISVQNVVGSPPPPPPPPPTADTTPPVITFDSPQNGDVVSGIVPVSVRARDESAIASLIVTRDISNILGLVSQPEFAADWYTRAVPNDQYTLTAYAVDESGNESREAITVTVENQLTSDQPPAARPIITLTDPKDQTKVAGTVPVMAAVRGQDIERVEFYYDHDLVFGVDSTAPYGTVWETAAVGDGKHTLFAKAYGRGGLGVSEPIAVEVHNAAGLSAKPTIAFSQRATSIRGRVRINVKSVPTVKSATFVLDGSKVLATDRRSPFAIAWNSSSVSNGPHLLTATVITANNVAVSSTAKIRTINRLAVSFSRPKKNATVRKITALESKISGGYGVRRVSYGISRPKKSLGSATKAPYRFSWDTRKIRNGKYRIIVTVTDRRGAKATATVPVWVRN